ncbi:MAG: hypothetical protein ACI9C9_001120, partial [Marivirga sp.]
MVIIVIRSKAVIKALSKKNSSIRLPKLRNSLQTATRF